MTGSASRGPGGGRRCGRRRSRRRRRSRCRRRRAAFGYLVQHDQPDQHGERRLEAHQGPERRRGEPAQRQQLEGEGDDRQQQSEADADEQQLGGQPAEGARAGDDRGGQGGDGHGHGQRLDALDAVADVLGQQDVRRPAPRRGQRIGHAHGVDRARPRLGQHQHADGGQGRPDLGAALAPRHRDAERPEELQRAGRPEREPGQRGHEEQGDPRGHQPQQHAGGERLARVVAAARPDHDEQQHPGPGEPEPGCALGAEVVDQADRRGQAELDAEHRGDRHRGAGASPVCVHALHRTRPTVRVHV